jgi:GntR family transcriptional regulator
MENTEKAYNRVTSSLRERILAGDFKPQAQLPTERELSEHYGVSRITVRRALEILEEEHLITRRQGKGTFVSPQPTRRIPLYIDYARSVHAHAPSLRRELLVWKWMEVPDWVSVQLKIEQQELVFYCERRDVLEERVVAWDQAYLVRSFADKLKKEDLERVEFTDVWSQKCSFPIVSCRQIVEAAAADEEVSEKLETSSRAPVLKGIEIYYTLYDRPTGLFVNYYHPEYISLVSNFNWTTHASGANSSD